MSIRIDIKRSDYYNDLNVFERKIFDCKGLKYIHNIDTLYYSIFLKNDSNESYLSEIFVRKLKKMKEELKFFRIKDKSKSSMPFVLTFDECGVHDFETPFILTYKRFAIYEYCLSVPDMFDVFISDYLPNVSTPRIVVQLRSFYLWGDTYDKCVLKSYCTIKKILDVFNLDVDIVRENRIDFCYHTNCIQNAYSFFNDNMIKNDMITTLDKYQKIGNIYKDDITLDYFALGQRKSNNLFVRIYNKSREVIEEGYKSFFFEIWRKNGLISEYDFYCYKYAFLKKTFNSLDEARLQYYIEYGHDERVKGEFEKTLNDKNVQYENIKKLADSYMPKVTIIMNIEFQTKRKFYFNADMLSNLPIKIKNNVPELNRLFQILDNRDIVLDYLTSESLSFGKHIEKNKFCYSDWWTRLRSCKVDSLETDFKFIRQFNYNCDKAKILKRAINSVASLGVYNHNNDSEFIDDISDMLCFLNDNDQKMILGDFGTGEVLQLEHKILKDYKFYKEKKYKAVKNRLSTKQ